MIAFATPWMLWGLAVAALPVLLHLFARREPPVVVFPAVRYLTDTARLHPRRLTLQHLVLLIVRTLLLVLLVLAAAGPTAPHAAGGGHAPSALILVMDNSLSSGATEGGIPLLERLRAAGGEVLNRAGGEDALWLLPADGIPRRGGAAELRRALDSLAPMPRRLDLGVAIGIARQVLASEPRPGEIMVLTDLQSSAVSPLRDEGPGGRTGMSLTVVRPGTDPVVNAGVGWVETGTQPWTGGRAPIGARLAGNATAPVPVNFALDQRAVRQALGTPGDALTVLVPAAPPGWHALVVELAPDELRLDDRWEVGVRVAPPAMVHWSDEDRFLAAASAVLRDAGRIRRGGEVTLGGVGSGPSVVVPPADPARLGAVNRALGARGVPWRYGPLLLRSAVTDSSAFAGPVTLTRRHALEPVGSGQSGVLVRVENDPWLVRAGNVVVLGSRLDTAWTELPLQAGFVPFVDALVNRLVRGELAVLLAAPGEAVRLPDAVDAVVRDQQRWAVEGGAVFRPAALGIHFLLGGFDTVGVLSVNPDPRESDLARARDAQVRAAWPGARIVAPERAADSAFRAAARGDLRPLVLALVLGLVIAEAGLAGWRRSSS